MVVPPAWGRLGLVFAVPLAEMVVGLGAVGSRRQALKALRHLARLPAPAGRAPAQVEAR
jgi:hypothetical protein